jgi:hypothetical protein
VQQLLAHLTGKTTFLHNVYKVLQLADWQIYMVEETEALMHSSMVANGNEQASHHQGH